MKRWAWLAAGLAVIILAVALGRAARRASAEAAFAELPVLEGGRVKPLDSVARNSLLLISGRQSMPGKPAIHWLLDVMFRPAAADRYKVFEIDDPDALGLVGIEQGRERRYSFADLDPGLVEIRAQGDKARQVPADRRSRFQTAVLHLEANLTLYQKLQNTIRPAPADNWLIELDRFDRAVASLDSKVSDPHGTIQVMDAFQERYGRLAAAAEFRPLAFPAGGTIHWVSVGDALLARFEAPSLHPGIIAYARMAETYAAGDQPAFAEAVQAYHGWMNAQAPGSLARARWELLFNSYAPFMKALFLYGIVCILIFLSFLVRPEFFRRTAWGLLLVAFAVHTAGLFLRIWLQGRPPVTNLYSSAIFVGWVAVILGIVLERFYRNGIGSLAAAGIGFLTQIIAHHLAAAGDTMEMMRAVLDSNFWLATHVVAVTIGYSSTFISGFLAAFYIVRGMTSGKFSAESARNVARMVYGIVCFSTLFSFVGTVLGGIWADQSWGRFWGWDPKENGALMIVLWNALVLHLRWGGFVGQKGLMVAVVFGNVVTALSWFGVNMLGIGLHSYGFMDKAFPWLAGFIALQLILMALGALPARFWASRPWPQTRAAKAA